MKLMNVVSIIVEFIWSKLIIGACVAVVVYALPSIIAEGFARGLLSF